MGFDEYALSYDADLCRGLRWSGRGPEWFAERRVERLREYARSLGLAPRRVVEFGCGTGNHVPFLRAAFHGCRFIGVDISRESLDVAAARFGGPDVRFSTPEEYAHEGEADVVYVNGVFHHIPPAEHARWLRHLHDVMATGALLAVFDNNPFSIPARLVMRSIPFDRDAIMVNPYGFARLMRVAGFGDPRLRFHFLFPRALSCLSPIESAVSGLPLGAQFSLFARREG